MFQIFYCCYSTGIEASAEEMVQVKTKEKLLGYAIDVLREPEDFFGIVDAQDMTLQFYLEDDGGLWVEIPSPEEKGSFGKIFELSELAEIVDLVNLPFTKEMIPNLEFTAWED